MLRILHELWWDESGNNVVDHALMLVVIVVILVSMFRLICPNLDYVFSQINGSFPR